MTSQLVLLRHGQSLWNLENRFTGWQDIDLSDQGQKEARRAGVAMREAELPCDVAFTSLLKRAIRTLWIALDEMDRMWVPVYRDWTLNERHYGALTGLDKKESVRNHGPEQVHEWRRSFHTRPPAMEPDDPRHPRFDPRYRDVDPDRLPSTECLADCLDRVVPYYEETIRPHLQANRRVLVCAHGNSLRALVMHLDGLDPDAVSQLNIPTGFPLVYELRSDGRPESHRYLGDPAEIEAAIQGVAGQTATDA